VVFNGLKEYYLRLSGRPTLPPYWALGLHVCRDAAREAPANSSLVFQQEAEQLELPFDSDCIDDSALGNATFVVEEERLAEVVCFQSSICFT
jgi:alpha-glucosidase (family GH31 glycosyl hydrolase)